MPSDGKLSKARQARKGLTDSRAIRESTQGGVRREVDNVSGRRPSKKKRIKLGATCTARGREGAYALMLLLFTRPNRPHPLPPLPVSSAGNPGGGEAAHTAHCFIDQGQGPGAKA
eukprot:scaffold186091_cov37-Tisochrysis_lutea.AAC.1